MRNVINFNMEFSFHRVADSPIYVCTTITSFPGDLHNRKNIYIISSYRRSIFKLIPVYIFYYSSFSLHYSDDCTN